MKVNPGKNLLIKGQIFPGIIIVLLTFIAFFPSLNNDFISTWDDNLFVTDNPLIRHLDFEAIKSMFTTPVAGAYVPLPLLSFAVEYHFFGLNPFPYHVTNLVLHLLCTLLVFQFLRLLKLGDIYAAAGALIFGIHPMHVESVAWISERKDLLYSLFYLSSLIFYMKFIDKKNHGLKNIILSLFLFVLALFSKIQAVTLPLILLVIDYYLREDLTPGPSPGRGGESKQHSPAPFRGGVGEGSRTLKIPFFALALIFGIAGILILNKGGGFKPNEIYSLSDRLFYGFYALTGYIIKFIVPVHLSIYYPYPVSPGQSLPLIYWLNPVLLVILGFLIYKTLLYTRAIASGFLFFLFSIMFMLQIIAVGYTYSSDRYSYISYVGLCFITGWSLERFFQNKKRMKYILTGAMLIVIFVFVSLTYSRCKTWQNAQKLWTDALDKYPEKNVRANFNRGLSYGKPGQLEKAIIDFSRAIEINPEDRDSHYNRGLAYMKLEQWEKAVKDFTIAIEIDPENAGASFNRGLAYAKLSQSENAALDFSKVIKIDPENKNAYFNRGLVYKNIDLWDKAIADFSAAIEKDPYYIAAYFNRGESYRNLNNQDEAIADYEKTLELNPTDEAALMNLGNVWFQKKDFDKAIEISLRGLKIYPQNAGFYDNIGYYYMEKGDYSAAIDYFQGCLNINQSFFDALVGLAMVYFYKNDQASAKKYLNRAQSVEPRLNKGIEGLTELEKSGISFSGKKKQTLIKMFNTFNE